MDHRPRFLALTDAARARVTEIDSEDVLAWMREERDLLVVDVREDREWMVSHVTGAIHLGKGVIERDIERHVPDLDTMLILYCGGGYRSALAAEALGAMGYRNVYSLAGGFRAWKAVDGPITRAR